MNADSQTYVLIPGAWHGGWVWRPVAERLRAAGHRAVCLTLPGLGDGDDQTGLRLGDAVDHVVREVERLNLDAVTLVGHSWGGYPMTGAVHRLRGTVSSVIYYSAFVPSRGVSLVEENPEVGAFLGGLIDESPDHAVHPSLELVQGILMQGADEGTQRLVAELLTPQPADYILDSLDVPSVTETGISARY
ncbi:alpha/beta fold hydrolase, partial [Streptomyces sp. NPDC058691]|uniref:alpha/beta fold hydrolase n=1 Tax=Streptomyces sp. NPDC058691 TaxID=3346601 RepID=UPI0036611E8A